MFPMFVSRIKQKKTYLGKKLLLMNIKFSELKHTRSSILLFFSSYQPQNNHKTEYANLTFMDVQNRVCIKFQMKYEIDD